MSLRSQVDCDENLREVDGTQINRAAAWLSVMEIDAFRCEAPLEVVLCPQTLRHGVLPFHPPDIRAALLNHALQVVLEVG